MDNVNLMGSFQPPYYAAGKAHHLCCYVASVVDATDKLVCECRTLETAIAIADALNDDLLDD